jgi:hypothetical protein
MINEPPPPPDSDGESDDGLGVPVPNDPEYNRHNGGSHSNHVPMDLPLSKVGDRIPEYDEQVRIALLCFVLYCIVRALLV